MKITALELACRDLEAQKRFYTEVLGLPLLASTATHFIVQIGGTQLGFQLEPGLQGVCHFAFNIPENQLAEAKNWIQHRAALLRKDGQDEFDANTAWNAQMFYFCDPDGNILECIARHRLANTSDKAFGPASLLNISEVGWPVEDVPQGVERFQQEVGLSVFGSGSDTFMPLGDDEGLLIVVQLGRPWFPTTQTAARLPLRLTLTDAAEDLEAGWDAAPEGVT